MPHNSLAYNVVDTEVVKRSLLHFHFTKYLHCEVYRVTWSLVYTYVKKYYTSSTGSVDHIGTAQ